MNVKKEYARKEELLANERAEAQRRTKEAEKLKQSIKADVQKQAKEMIKAKAKGLESNYQAKTSSHYIYVTGVSLYAVLVTLFTAIRSETFVSDFKSFFYTIWRFILKCVEMLRNGANFVAQLGDKIQQPIVATILHWLLWLIIVLVVSGGVCYLAYNGIVKLIEFYKKDYADNFSLGVALVSLSVLIFFADEIRAIVPINLLLLLIIAHILYVGVRWYIKGYRENRGY